VFCEQYGSCVDQLGDVATVDFQHKRFSGRKVAVQRSLANPGALRDRLHRGVTRLSQACPGGIEDARTIEFGVCSPGRSSGLQGSAERCHGTFFQIGIAKRTCVR
jgi:hypothetical protein